MNYSKLKKTFLPMLLMVFMVGIMPNALVSATGPDTTSDEEEHYLESPDKDLSREEYQMDFSNEWVDLSDNEERRSDSPDEQAYYYDHEKIQAYFFDEWDGFSDDEDDNFYF